jgi:pyruvate dehydrogenase E2 component (dihydrolipoamide acetyltransferase)
LALQIVMPRLSDSMVEGTILKWLVAEGDAVDPGQPLAEIETDKATVIHEADDSGVILGLTVREGAVVPVGAPIAILGEEGEELPVQSSAGAPAAGPEPTGASLPVAAASTAAADQAAETPPAGVSAPAPFSASPVRAKASPLARRLAAAHGVDLNQLTGSGTGGRVIRADVERAAEGANGAAAAPPTEITSTKGRSSRQPLTRTQATIARRMAESRATVPDIELRREVDMSATVSAREQLRGAVDPLPSINDFIVRAAALALREFARVNGAYRDGTFETYSRVNVGIAVAAPDALVVPTIFDADTKSLAEIASVARALGARVRDGSISPAELSGGTFTVSNLGMYGVDSFSPVINPPQAAILAVGSLRPRPVVDEASGAIVARPTVTLTLACDHRILYGADGARFLARLAELLERPLLLFV